MRKDRDKANNVEARAPSVQLNKKSIADNLFSKIPQPVLSPKSTLTPVLKLQKGQINFNSKTR